MENKSWKNSKLSKRKENCFTDHQPFSSIRKITVLSKLLNLIWSQQLLVKYPRTIFRHLNSTESQSILNLKGLTRISTSNSQLCTEEPQKSHHVSEIIVQTLPQVWQAWCLLNNHLPYQIWHVSMEKPTFNIYSKNPTNHTAAEIFSEWNTKTSSSKPGQACYFNSQSSCIS